MIFFSPYSVNSQKSKFEIVDIPGHSSTMICFKRSHLWPRRHLDNLKVEIKREFHFQSQAHAGAVNKKMPPAEPAKLAVFVRQTLILE